MRRCTRHFVFLYAVLCSWVVVPAQDHVLEMVPPASLSSTGLDRIIDRQLTVLDKGGAEARGRAQDILRNIAWRAAIPRLRKEIRPGKNRYNAVAALLTLDGLGGEEVRQIVRKVLFSDQFNRKERLAAALVLAKLEKKNVVRDLADAMRLATLREELKVGLAYATIRNPDRRLKSGLGRLASLPVRPTRVWAAVLLALAEIGGGSELRPLVLQLGRSGNPRIRRAACLAAARLTDRSTMNMLFEKFKLEKNDPWTVVCSTVSIGLRSQDCNVSSLLNTLRSSEGPIREFAALALGWFVEQRVTQALKRTYQKERKPEVRVALIRALERHKDASLMKKALEDQDPGVRAAAMLLAVHVDRTQAIRGIDHRLVRETEQQVIETGLAVRLVVSGLHLPPDHRARGGGTVTRILRKSPWKDLDRYRGEPRSPAWQQARDLYQKQKKASSPPAVRARLLNASMLELLELQGKFEMPERRVLVNRRSSLPSPPRSRSFSELSREEEDLKIWLQRRPFFQE